MRPFQNILTFILIKTVNCSKIVLFSTCFYKHQYQKLFHLAFKVPKKYNIGFVVISIDRDPHLTSAVEHNRRLF